MRRFKDSLSWKMTCHVVMAGLLLPFLTLLLATNSSAQVAQRPRWAVLDFQDTSGLGGDNIGRRMAEAVNTGLVQLGRYDVEPQETVDRKAAELGLVQPINDRIGQLRLAGDLGAQSIIIGDVKNWAIRNVGSGKRASIVVRAVVIDVASGLPVNGAALQASSSVRPSDTPNDAVLSEAIANAATVIVQRINQQTLPEATVLNTMPDIEGSGVRGPRNRAMINQGVRTGFAVNQNVIITRGRQQVATARVIEVEADSAHIQVIRSDLGVQPGDKVRVVFEVPDISSRITDDDSVQTPRRRGGDSSVISILLILGLVAVLLSGGRGSNQDLANDVRAEATSDPSGTPGVRISWGRDFFARGNSQTYAWQIYRNDVLGSPVIVAPGNFSSIVDNAEARDLTYSNFGGVVGGIECRFSDPQLTTATEVPGVVTGRTYQYEVALVYRLASIDLPDGGNTGGTATGGGFTTGGTTGGITTGGGTTTGGTTGGITTGGTTGGTTTTTGGTGGTTTGGTGGGSECYFITTRVRARGLVTPLAKTQLVSPAPNAVVTQPIPFTFQSAVNPAFPTTMSYALQISASPTFPRNGTVTLAKFDRNDIGLLSTQSVDTSQYFPGVTEVWWRVGARAVADNPGPVPDASGERYVFSEPRRFTRPGTPPPPPVTSNDRQTGGTVRGALGRGG